MKQTIIKIVLAVIAIFTVQSAVAQISDLPQNPYLAANGGATMHGDAMSSDVSPYAGPLTSSYTKLTSQKITHNAVCPTVLFGSDAMPVSLCTQIFGRAPVVNLLDPQTNKILASRVMQKGSLLGGVYAFMDNEDRLVMVDGNDNLLRIGHTKTEGYANFWDWWFGKKTVSWQLQIQEQDSVASIVRGNCGNLAGCDSVVGLVPDWDGNVFLATKNGTVGVFNPMTKQQEYIKLGNGERIDNSISSAPNGVAVTTSHATYLLRANDMGKPYVVWRQAYDRGSARKPGQLSHGTGATATFFGPQTGSEYVTITDNADEQINLLVYKTNTGEEVCKHPVFNKGASGTENSAIAYQNSIYVANTYGYPYPKYPEGAGESVPKSAPFAGGMERIDIVEDDNGEKVCKTVWKNETVKSAAVPRLSSVNGYIYTTERKGIIEPGYQFYTTVIDSETGQTLQTSLLGFGFIYDTLEMVGTITPNNVWYQGILSGVTKIQ